jgi:hypothetical protein
VANAEPNLSVPFLSDRHHHGAVAAKKLDQGMETKKKKLPLTTGFWLIEDEMEEAGMIDCLAAAQAEISAHRASVAAFVTFHYRPDKMTFLNRVLRNLSAFQVARMRVTIITNTDNPATRYRIAELCRNHFPLGDYEIASFPGLDPGTMLTWKHKPLLRAAVQAGHTHFIYLEDDIDLTFENFLYFVRYVDTLNPLGFVPSFLRTEFNNDTGELRSTDATHVTSIGEASLVEVYGQTFASPAVPYCARYVLNKTLADEYVGSRSFDYEQSGEVHDWGIPERAAMGVCWENPVEGYAHRYLLPISPYLVPLPCCQTPHMPSNYTNADTPFGRIAVKGLFSIRK